jgi:flagellin
MSNVINTNVKSLMARDAMTINQRALTTTMQRLSTGKRINSAADDAAGLGIATRMDSQIKGLNMAIKNANDTVSVVQTAEGAMQEVNSILQRMRELAVQSASDTNGSVDRTYLQAEVSQLSTEIDRIAATTQFNSMNLLDGSFKSKVFQIGANQGQTIGMSIASMKSSVLGVASSNTTKVEPPSAGTPSPISIDGVSAQGTKAVQTVTKLKFEENDTYTFTIADDVSGITAAGVTAQALDLTSQVSKDDFVDALNKSLKDAAVNTSVVSNASYLTWTAANHNLDDATKAGDFKFSISIDGGTPQKSIDLLARLRSNGAANSPLVASVTTAMQTELQALYGTSITVVGTGANGFTVSDSQGRSIEITQGAGSGALFGTDAANAVTPLFIAGNIQSNLSAKWDGNDIVITNKAGGKTTVAGYVAVAASKVMFDANPDSQSNQIFDPIALTAAAVSDTVRTFKAPVEASKLSLIFSDTVGTTATATYTFDLTNGAGDKYATVTALDVFSGFGATAAKTDASVVAAVTAALATGTTTLSASDASFDTADFQVSYKAGVLSITNSEGRALAIENFKSDVGHVTVVPQNELAAVDILSTRTNTYSEGRWSLKTADLTSGGLDTAKWAGADAGKYNLTIDGVEGTVSVDIVGMGAGFADGAAVATALQTAIRLNVTTLQGGQTASVQSLLLVTASFDEVTNDIVIRDAMGRSISLAPTTANVSPDALFNSPGVTVTGMTGIAVKTDSKTVQGDSYEASKVTMTFNQDNVLLDFAINGIFLSNATATTGADVLWKTNDTEKMATFATKMDALMLKLNSVHAKDVFEYKINGAAITVYQRDGGPIEISSFEGPANGLKATLTPATGQGAVSVIQNYGANATANSEGTKATITSAVLQLNGLNDLISLSVSDGVNNYSLAATAVDTNSLSSTQALAKDLNKALGNSTIKASMDTNGKIYLTDTTGGTITLTSFSSGRGLEGVWSPEVGQGATVNLGSSYAGDVGGVISQDPGSPSVGGGTSSVKQISVLTQAGSNKALAVLDSALTYVNSERAKLGAIENRLTHTVDNLTNIVTNTAASKSRIMDTDYAAETTELARAQIIQQAATAMLAQANQQPQSVLALLK